MRQDSARLRAAAALALRHLQLVCGCMLILWSPTKPQLADSQQPPLPPVQGAAAAGGEAAAPGAWAFVLDRIKSKRGNCNEASSGIGG